jgi:antitoxin Phd
LAILENRIDIEPSPRQAARNALAIAVQQNGHREAFKMESQYTISQAKNRLPAIVHAVEKGPSVKLTRRGRPVAVLLSIKEYEKLCGNRVGFWDALTAIRKRAEKVDISDEDFKGLRDRTPGRAVELS